MTRQAGYYWAVYNSTLEIAHWNGSSWWIGFEADETDFTYIHSEQITPPWVVLRHIND